MVNYFKSLLKTYSLIKKWSRIIHSNSIKEADYLINELVDVVYLLREVDSSLNNGVPINHETIKNAVTTIHQILEEKLNLYYHLTTESLTHEIQIAKQLRLEYQARKEILNSIIDKDLRS